MARFHSKEERAKLPEAERLAEEAAVAEFASHRAPQWVKGQSGCPTGRTPKAAKDKLRDAAYMSVERLIKIAKDPNDKHYYEANQEIRDRVFGKAAQPLEIDENNNIVISFGNGSNELAE